MDGAGDGAVARGGGGVRELEQAITGLPSPSDESQTLEDVDMRIGAGIHQHHFINNQNSLLYGLGRSNVNFPQPGSNREWESGKYIIGGQNMRDDHISKLSPFSNENSEGSEREILLEPLSADDESTPVSESRALSAEAPDNEAGRDTMPGEEPSSGVGFGPSEDREDISDEELELYSQENGESHQPEGWASEDVQEGDHAASYNPDGVYNMPETPTEGSYPLVTSEAVPFNDNDARDSPSSEDREIIDLKYEDAAGKSDAGSQDEGLNQQSNVPSEELETVSDDELPDGALAGDGLEEQAFSLIEGGEEVSSSDDETAARRSMHVDSNQELSLVNRTNKLVLDGPEFASGNVGASDLGIKVDEASTLQLIPEPTPSIAMPLAPLEAEPISDEEDLGHGDGRSIDVEGGEAGEIKSPSDAGSPASQLGQTAVRLLGEVEPISADESSDTDGELPSGDEDSLSKAENGGANASNFLESIDSDDEGDLGHDLPHKHLSPHSRQTPTAVSESLPKQKTQYMETISDEDSLSVSGKEVRRSESSVKAEESHASVKSKESERRQISTNYSEHQEELDYEENEGEEGEGKSAAEAVKPTEKKEVKEANEKGEGGSSDKDEGELSDDDCEEGEIKEPGSKRPYVAQTCRFFLRGNCTWGINCRFIHPGINDKGNYQMIEIPGFKPLGVRSRLGIPGQWPEPEEQIELPPPPVPDVPPIETAWERGLRIAKEQRKKASERKELEADFEDKRLNLSVDEERELNKENERMPKIIPKDPYYDQYGVEEDNYYHTPRDPWQTGRYENFEVRYNTDHAYSPPYREKPPVMPPPPLARFGHPYSPPADIKFGRDRVDRREPFRLEGPPLLPHEYPTANKRPDEWTDPWRRSKSPKSNLKRKIRSRSRGRRTRRSVSDSSNSSRSSSGSSSGSSRSSRSFNSSTGSSSRSRSPVPAPPGPEKHERYISPSREQPRSTVSIRGSGNYNHYDQGYRRGGRMYDQNRGPNNHNQRGGNRGGGGGSYNNNYGNMGAPPPRDVRDRERLRDDRMVRKRVRSPPDRPLPYVRPRPKSVSSHSSSSRSGSRSRGRATSSRSRSQSRSSSASSRSSSSSSSSAGSADSEHLYRDLGSPSKNPRAPPAQKRKRNDSVKDRPVSKTAQIPLPPGSQRRQPPPPQPAISLEHIPPPRDPKPPLPPLPSGRPESKYASRNAPPAPVKAKDPLKVVGQKSNIKLTLLPKQQQQSALGARPNPLDSPPHKRRLSERDTSPPPAPPAKRINMPPSSQSQSTALRLAIEKASKIQIRQEKGKSPPPAIAPQSLPSASLSANIPRTRTAMSPQKQPSSAKPRVMEPPVAKTAPKAPAASPTPTATGTKAKKSMSSRREELLKQLKAVEDAIARKKSKLQ
ncbi:hypothetical protein BsWGS_15957 [Bradybaena similaris]